MPAELNSRISRDWFDMKGSLAKSEPPLEIFSADISIFREMALYMEDYAENGLIQAKKSLFNRLFTDIKELQFKAIPKKEFIPMKNRAAILVLIVWLERALLEGHIHLTGKKKTKNEEKGPDLKEIIAEINLFARNNPKMLQSGGKISKIIKLVKVMQEEQQKTREILSHPENLERKDTIVANFRQRYSEMEINIRQIFADFRRELDEKSGLGPKEPLYKQIDTDKFKKNIHQQLRQFLEIFSGLSFASEQSSGLAEIYKYLLYHKEEMEKPLRREEHIINEAVGALGKQDRESAARELQNALRFALMDWLHGKDSARDTVGGDEE